VAAGRIGKLKNPIASGIEPAMQVRAFILFAYDLFNDAFQELGLCEKKRNFLF
jgi:hypothetical protein